MTSSPSNDDEAPDPGLAAADGGSGDRRSGRDRREGSDRRSGRDRRGQPRPAWTPLPDPDRAKSPRPYYFRSFIDRRERADRRSGLDRRLDDATVELSPEELKALLGSDGD